MSGNIILDIGSLSLLFLVGLTLRVVAGINGCKSHGQEALVVSVGVLMTILLIRIFRDNLNLISSEQATKIASIAYLTGVIILSQLIYILHKVNHVSNHSD